MNLLLIGVGIDRRLFAVSNSNAFLTGSAKAPTDYTPRFRNDPASRVTFDRGAKEATVTIALGDNDTFDGYGSRQFYVYLAEPNFGKVDRYKRTQKITIIDDGMFHIFTCRLQMDYRVVKGYVAACSFCDPHAFLPRQ